MLLKNSKGIIVGSLKTRTCEIWESGRCVGTIQKYNAYCEPINFDASFKVVKKIDCSIGIQRINNIFKK